MLVKIEISKSVWNRLQGFLSDWRRRDTREKLLQWFLSCVWMQERSNARGRKKALDLPVIEMGDNAISALLPKISSQTKFRRLVVEYGLVIKDRSWVAPNISSRDRRRKCDAWHFVTEDPGDNEMVTVSFDPHSAKFGPHMAMIRDIEKADGTVVGDGFVFRGDWIVEDWKAGRLSPEELKMAWMTAKCAGRAAKEDNFRVFDSISIASKKIRSSYFVDISTGRTIHEAIDLNAASLVCAEIAAALVFGNAGSLRDFGDVARTDDSSVVRYAWRLIKGTERDAYREIWDAEHEIDPNSGVLAKNWRDGVRKTTKGDLVMTVNYGMEEIAACRTAYLVNFRGGMRVRHNRRRQWLCNRALKKTRPTAWASVQACRLTGDRGLFYRFFTLGEKMIMSAIREELHRMGIKGHRVHDAIWCSEELPEAAGAIAGRAILRAMGLDRFDDDSIRDFFIRHANGNRKDGILAMYRASGIDGRFVKEIVDELGELTPDQRRILRDAQRNPSDMLETAFPDRVQERLWMRGAA